MDFIVSNFSVYNITEVRCRAHTLQLCVHDVIKVPEIKNKLDTIRSMVNKLRTQTYLNMYIKTLQLQKTNNRLRCKMELNVLIAQKIVRHQGYNIPIE